jgi:hypothetical protein
MSGRAKIQIAAILIIAVFGIGIWAEGGVPHMWWLKFYSIAVAVVAIASTAWDHYFWRTGIFQKLRTVPRCVAGTWKGTLRTQWVDPSSGKAPEPKTAYLVIRQTSTTVDVRLITDESESRSTFGQVSSGSEPPTLDYLYLNEPMNSLRDRSPIHHGSASMKIVGRPASRLTGHYWTDRDTRGELDMKWHKKETADDFESSEGLFSQATGA